MYGIDSRPTLFRHRAVCAATERSKRHLLSAAWFSVGGALGSIVFTARRYALHGLSYRNSVRLSVRLSVTLVDCVHMVRPTIMISSPYGSPIILVSGDITFIPKFERCHPERGR